jgi:hypothetical protein
MDASLPNRWVSKANMPKIVGNQLKWAASRIYGSQDQLKLKLGDPKVNMYFEFLSTNDGKLHSGKSAIKSVLLENKEYSDL